MPHTLAHIGLQYPVARGIFGPVDPRWIALGLMIPDIPWIWQRLAILLFPDFSPIWVRAYLVTMTTPLFCAVLAAAIALLFHNSIRLFLIVYSQSLLHLLLDACEFKGGVGIPFLAPFSWESPSFSLFPMDGWFNNLLTLLGVFWLVLILTGKIRYHPLPRPVHFLSMRATAAFVMILSYVLIPLSLTDTVIKENVHDLGVWAGKVDPVGRSVHFDRARYLPGNPGTLQDDFNETPLPVLGIEYPDPALVSCEAVFRTPELLEVDAFVIHPPGRRFSFTLIGLTGIVFIWTYPLFKKSKRIRDQK